MKVKLFKIRISEDYLVQDQNRLDDFMSSNEIIKFETAFVAEKDSYWSVIIGYHDALKDVVQETDLQDLYHEEDILTTDEANLLESLKIWRSEKAKEQSLPTYFIASNKALLSVVKSKPSKKDDLKDIKGFGKHKIENYGQEIIHILEGS